VVFWSGLRGAVSTALALSLPLDFPNRPAMQGITFGVVLLTLLLQATTAELVVARWGSDRAGAQGEEQAAIGSGSAP
jgi:CPA1 family monovalent cation:H+ antiporter